MAEKTYYPRNPLTQHFLRTGAILPEKAAKPSAILQPRSGKRFRTLRSSKR